MYVYKSWNQLRQANPSNKLYMYVICTQYFYSGKRFKQPYLCIYMYVQLCIYINMYTYKGIRLYHSTCVNMLIIIVTYVPITYCIYDFWCKTLKTYHRITSLHNVGMCVISDT